MIRDNTINNNDNVYLRHSILQQKKETRKENIWKQINIGNTEALLLLLLYVIALQKLITLMMWVDSINNKLMRTI